MCGAGRWVSEALIALRLAANSFCVTMFCCSRYPHLNHRPFRYLGAYDVTDNVTDEKWRNSRSEESSLRSPT